MIAPSTSEMLLALDSKLGGRSVVLACLRERAEETGRIGYPISELWKEYCYKAEPRADQGPVTGSGSADATTERVDVAPEAARLGSEGAAPTIADGGLFSGVELPKARSDDGPYQSIYVHFENEVDVAAFARLIKQPVTTSTRVINFPASIVSEAWLRAAVEEPDEESSPIAIAEQPNLFGYGEWWEEAWSGMPEFDQKDLAPRYSIQVNFPRAEDVSKFAALVDQPITPMARRTRSIWFPEAEIGRFADKKYGSKNPVGPAFPVYIVSKGRADSRLTSKHLHRLGVPHFIVVEPAEVEIYRRAVDPSATVLELDMAYKRDYDACDDLGETKGKGPGGARNFAWEHSIAAGYPWHWVMDDNIDGFFRLNKNLKTPVGDGTIFRAMEDFCLRYSNVAMAGPNYFMFASRKTKMPPFVLNTRIYSCNLIRNDSPYRWRGRYNEDTDLSLRMLKDGLCTVQFNAFLQFKLTTQTLGGGNTAEFYAAEGTKAKSEMQVKLHPDISRMVWKWGRWHHHVDYSVFRRNKLALRPGVTIPSGVENYGMELIIDPNYKPKGAK